MAGASGSTYTWSQSDLEDPVEEAHTAAANGFQGHKSIAAANRAGNSASGSASTRPLSTSLQSLQNDDKPSQLSSDSRNGTHRQSSQDRDSSSEQAASNSSPSDKAWAARASSLARQVSQRNHTLSHSEFSPSHAPASPFVGSNGSSSHSVWSDAAPAQNAVYRRTSNLVEESDPVVLSSSTRARSHSRGSIQWSTSPSASEEGSIPRNGIGGSQGSPHHHQNPGSRPASTTGQGGSSHSPSYSSDIPSQSWRSDSRVAAAPPPEHLQRSSSSVGPRQSVPEADGRNCGGLHSASAQLLDRNLTQPILPTQQQQARYASRDMSPLRREDLGITSPRRLAPMPESDEPLIGSQGPIGTPTRIARSSSNSAYGLGGPNSSAGSQASSSHGSSGALGARSLTSGFARPSYTDWGTPPDNGGGDGGRTARQSPVERRGGGPLYEGSNFSPFKTIEEDPNRPGMRSGTESRRHSISVASMTPAASSGGTRRAVGFEPSDGTLTNNTRSSSLARGYTVGSHLESATPRQRQGNARNQTGFSEDDLTADLGQLQDELDRISAEQNRLDVSQGRSINMRVPSSQAAASGAHASSMPPLFGERTNANSFSQSDWNAVLSPHPHQNDGPWGVEDAMQSKSRSVSLGPRPLSPARGAIPGRDRGRSGGHDGLSEQMDARRLPHAISSDMGGNLGRQNFRGPGSAIHGISQPGPYGLVQAGSRGLLPGSLGRPSAAGAVESGINASAAAFSPAIYPDTAQASALASQGELGRGPSSFGFSGLNETTLNSLATLGPLPPNVGGGPGDGSANLQDLGRGVPLSKLPQETPLYIVGFKQGRTDLFFKQPEAFGRPDDVIRRDDLVIVEADRGKDIGQVVNDSITVEQVQAFLAETEGMSLNGASAVNTLGHRAASAARTINPKRLFSKATAADTALLASKASDEERALAMCIGKVQQRALPMNVVAAELQWDRRKLTFYYTAANRVDFRALVAELFKLYKTRIWMVNLNVQRLPTDEDPSNGGAAPAGAVMPPPPPPPPRLQGARPPGTLSTPSAFSGHAQPFTPSNLPMMRPQMSGVPATTTTTTTQGYAYGNGYENGYGHGHGHGHGHGRVPVDGLWRE